MTRDLYMPEDAERYFKAHAGEPYQPSNGDEGEQFMGMWCHNCTKDNLDDDTGEGGCSIIAYTMALKVDDPDYPKEWVYGPEGQPLCTAFDERLEPGERETREAQAVAQKAYDALPRDPKTGRPVI